MRLSKLKLSGFKSFVDPTSVALPSALVGIVGPNGCGKSNIIDAVRWVMGESSAKHLRGESMDDVIFTGSSSRKPVGQASVEMVFDNSAGKLGGEYGKYAEIAIRREVTRDGTSKYFLNNTRCRRRDIRDVFLGTGLGPRSYAIIEQGMISRLIEAKPEDLRVFLEEAAGISKYKERRKETETRIRHTRDNLDRLDDLREEVDKQLAHLKRQANTAERYKVLKEEEREVKGQLLGLRWQDFQQQLSGRDASISEKEVSLEAVVADLRAAEASIEQDRQHQSAATETFNQQQAEFYRLGSEVSRVEQSITHKRESREQKSNELQQIEQSLKDAEQHIAQDKARIEEIDAAMVDDEPAYDQLMESQKYSADMLVQAEQKLAEWQTRWDAWSVRNHEISQITQLELSRMDQLERGVGQLDARIDRLQSEKTSLDVDGVAQQIEEMIARELEVEADEQRAQIALSAATGELQSLRETHQEASNLLDELRIEAQTLRGSLAALEVLQQAALGQSDKQADSWLDDLGVRDQRRLAQTIKAAPGWEKAVEIVLGPYLESVCVDSLTDICKRLDINSAAAENISFISQDPLARLDESTAEQWLVNKLDADFSLHELLSGIRCCEDLPAALIQRESLASGESIVTRDGIWLGRTWLRMGQVDVQAGVLQREKDITSQREALHGLDQRIEKQQSIIADLSTRLDEHESRRDTLQHTFNQCLRDVSEVKSGLAGGKQQLEQLHSRVSRLSEEITEAMQIRQQDEDQVKQSKTRRASALDELNQLAGEGEALQSEQEALREELEGARERAETDRSAGQEIALRVESMRSTRRATEDNQQRMSVQLEQFSIRRTELTQALSNDGDDTVDKLEASLAEFLQAHIAAEAALGGARQAVEEVDARLRSHEQSRVRHENRSASMREALQTERMESQEVRVRLKTIDEQLQEDSYDREAIMQSLPEEASLDAWSTHMADLERKIQRLGPINLAAIDEYDQQLERKAYLDEQHADVTDALATLEKAINKIDRETRSRFKDTFDKVNQKVEEFFPRLFGGGRASLEMTGDDLLSTGVSVLAQPPGKHVTNIQLLSGGEKALTAVALVFAFFELNPSPFCMLDEVDAPLDDANVGRFCEMVKEMSQRVQFIFITHNKVTMELSEQLMGVTMNEPGVSRLVAVDVGEAVELAGA